MMQNLHFKPITDSESDISQNFSWVISGHSNPILLAKKCNQNY